MTGVTELPSLSTQQLAKRRVQIVPKKSSKYPLDPKNEKDPDGSDDPDAINVPKTSNDLNSKSTQAMRPANQENIPCIPEGKGVLNTTKPVKRPALVESTNTLAQQQAVVNAAGKRNITIEKPIKVERTSKIQRPVRIEKPIVTARNPIRLVKANLKPIQNTAVIPSKSISKVNSLPVPVSSRSSTLTKKTSCLKAIENLPLAKLEISSKEREEINEPLPDVRLIEDIDANDRDSPFLVSPYVNEIYDYLRSLEKKYPITENYLKEAFITSAMRGTLVSWLVEVQVQYRLTPETLHQTIFIVDRYLQIAKDVPKSKLQLVGVTAMFIAAKYEETYCPEIEAFVFISDNAFTSLEVLMMEKKIVKSLNFAINRPLSIHFLRRYSKAAGATPLIHTYGKYFLELALLDYDLCHIRPSRIAAAATFLAISVSKNSSLSNSFNWTPELHYYSKYSFKNIKPVVSSLALTIQNVASSKKMQVVKRKYSQENLMRVSISSAVQPARIKELTEKQ